MTHDVTQSMRLSLDYDKIDKVAGQGVVPVIIQDYDTKEVLLLAYANREALVKTWQTGELYLWSTSRNRLWHKGADESGNTFQFIEARVNCEQNSILAFVRPNKGGICHTKKNNGECRTTCFYRVITQDADTLAFIPGEE
ncbi:MAG: phosphoribosyl-AMP cyclohydrolase [Oscillospiraceae bacterium]|jgi:phosphoribosyl-AMP cyclohydrolase|nr:phosphoribosyl-AMP cyclohydrolase [Oscillospiraceae bacterium]